MSSIINPDNRYTGLWELIKDDKKNNVSEGGLDEDMTNIFLIPSKAKTSNLNNASPSPYLTNAKFVKSVYISSQKSNLGKNSTKSSKSLKIDTNLSKSEMETLQDYGLGENSEYFDNYDDKDCDIDLNYSDPVLEANKIDPVLFRAMKIGEYVSNLDLRAFRSLSMGSIIYAFNGVCYILIDMYRLVLQPFCVKNSTIQF
jgi:hypothetical protein